MKKLLTLIITVLALGACTQTQTSEKPKAIKVEEKKEIKEEKEFVPQKKHPLYGSWENLDFNNYYILTFDKETATIDAPKSDTKKTLDLEYDDENIYLILNFDNFQGGLSKDNVVATIDAFFIFEFLDSISINKGNNFINKESQNVTFEYRYKIEDDRLFVNPNSPAQIIFFRKK
jgi:hypothetical protein